MDRSCWGCLAYGGGAMLGGAAGLWFGDRLVFRWLGLPANIGYSDSHIPAWVMTSGPALYLLVGSIGGVTLVGVLQLVRAAFGLRKRQRR